MRSLAQRVADGLENIGGGGTGLVGVEVGHDEDDVARGGVLAGGVEEAARAVLRLFGVGLLFGGGEGESAHDCVFGVVVGGVVVHAQLALYGRVPVVFYRVVGPSWQTFGDEGPLVADPAYLKRYLLCASMMASSSSSVHRSFLMSGLRWLCQRSRHCLPILPGKFLAMKLQFLGPWSRTSLRTRASSSLVCVAAELPRGP